MRLNHSFIHLDGYIANEPTIKKTPTGRSVCTFNIAVNHGFKNQDNDPNADEQVSYLDVEVWGKLAEICGLHAKKGKRVLVNGSIRQDRWKSPDGNSKQRVKVIGDDVWFNLYNYEEQQKAA